MITIFSRIIFTVLLVAVVTNAHANSARQLIAQGNAAYKAGNYDEALSHYDEASVEAPESAQIYFNRGAVHYQKQDYETASEAFKEAALKSKQPDLTSRAKYNLGNCAFREGERQSDSDLNKAIESCRASITHYQEAVRLNPQFKEAAENIEIVRLYIKALLDEQQKRQEQQDQQQKQEKDLGEKLKELIERQQAAALTNRNLHQQQKEFASEPTPDIRPPGLPAADPDTPPDPSDPLNPPPQPAEPLSPPQEWQDAVSSLADDQGKIQEDTVAVLDEMSQLKDQLQQQASAPPQPAQPGQPAPPAAPMAGQQEFIAKLDAATPHVTEAINAQGRAIPPLNNTQLEPAQLHQVKAVEELLAALQELADEQQQQQQGQDDQQQQDQQDQNQDEQQQQDGQDQQDQQQDGQDQQDQQQNPEDQQQQGEPDQQQPQNETARGILDEEKQNQKDKQPARAGRVRPVDKDW